MTEGTAWERGAQWVSRTLAVVAVMVFPGIAGDQIDKRLGTQIFAPIGFGLGLLFGTTALVVLARKFTPAAGGTPLPWPDEKTGEEGSGPDKNSDSSNTGPAHTAPLDQ